MEVKIVDPSANPYFASAAILGLALDGIEAETPLPPETTVDPATQTALDREGAGTVQLPSRQAEIIAALDNSKRMRSILGDPAVDVVVAVRRHEHDHYGDLEPVQLAEKSRMAWST